MFADAAGDVTSKFDGTGFEKEQMGQTHVAFVMAFGLGVDTRVRVLDVLGEDVPRDASYWP